jgi:hypothetical protein
MIVILFKWIYYYKSIKVKSIKIFMNNNVNINININIIIKLIKILIQKLL